MLLFAGPAALLGQEGAQTAAKEKEAKLLAVLESDAQPKEKADACR